MDIIQMKLSEFKGMLQNGNLVSMEFQVLADMVELGKARHFDLNI